MVPRKKRGLMVRSIGVQSKNSLRRTRQDKRGNNARVRIIGLSDPPIGRQWYIHTWTEYGVATRRSTSYTGNRRSAGSQDALQQPLFPHRQGHSGERSIPRGSPRISRTKYFVRRPDTWRNATHGGKELTCICILPSILLQSAADMNY